MGLGLTIIGLLALLIIGFVFYEEITNGIDAFAEDRAQTEVEEELGIVVEVDETGKPTQELCDLVITFYGEIEHELFSLPTILRFEFGSNTNHPEVAVWEYRNCGLTLATFIPRIPTYLTMISEDSNLDKLTDDELTALSLTSKELEQLDLISTGDSYNMQIKIIDADDRSTFRNCGTTHPDLCRVVILPAGVVPEPYEFQKTFIIKKIPKQDYIIEITIEGQRINSLSANAPYSILLDLDNPTCLTELRIASGARTSLGSLGGNC